MSVFFTDTDCELWYTDAEKYNINIIGMPYTINGVEKVYDMGKNTNFKEMYDMMRAGAMPSTAALNPQDYIDYFEPVFERGEDIFYVHFSDQLSGTFNHMAVALNELKEKYPERKITLFNTKNICYGAGLQALLAGKMHYEGKSDEEILEFLNEFAPTVQTKFVVDSLFHLKRGGRVSATSAVVGSLLNIKPLLKISEEGKIEKYATVKGMKKAVLTLAQECVENVNKDYQIIILHADNLEMAELAKGLVREKLGDDVEINIYPIGPVIGSHCGPGTTGVVYSIKK